jgi:hypothetical protein
VLEKIAGKYASTSSGSIPQIAKVLANALAMLSLERKMMRTAFDLFLQLT